MSVTSNGASTSNGGHSTESSDLVIRQRETKKMSDLVIRLRKKKSSWEKSMGPEPNDPRFWELVSDFKKVSDMTEMNLVGEDLGDSIISAMGTAMVEVPFLRLTSLQLGGNYVTEVGVRSVAKAIELGRLPALESLGVFPLRTANERQRFVRREETQWSRNVIYDDGVRILASAFASGHARNLKVLTLENNGFGTEGARALADEIRAGNLPSLEILNLSYNCVGDEGVRSLATAFVEAGNKLRVLDLETCYIFGSGTRALARALMSGRFPALTELYLGNNNNISGGPREGQLVPIDEGLMELARVLEKGQPPKLQILDLQHDATISKSAAEAFRNAARNNKSLVVTLKINWPSFGSSENSYRRFLERNKRVASILERLQGEKDVPATSGKVFLCGHPREGKTTLRRSLQMDLPGLLVRLLPEKKKRDEPRTRGIEVSHIVSKGWKGGEKIRLAVWDLAGQAEYQVLHSAFLPDLALADGQATTFVIVCNAKYPGDDIGGGHHGRELLNYWMRFIASSSLKGEERDKRHVLLVLNRFDDERCEYLDRWENYLTECKELFHEYLDVEEHPFVVDARVARSVRDLKEHLIQHTREKLKSMKVPGICQYIQDTISKAVKTRDFPVVSWAWFADTFQSSVSDEKKLKAAVDYLHESGHLIQFREGWEGRNNEGSAGRGRSLVVLDPDWFCRRVVGNLLLPAAMLVDGELPLARKVGSDGSIALSDLEAYFHHLLRDKQQVSDIVAILLRLGICYMAGTEKVLIPTLISDRVLEGNQNPIGIWFSGMEVVRDQWVMGYCLKVQYRTTTLLPIAVFRRLQVELAQHQMCKAADAEYTSGKFNITFGTNGMAVLVEFSANETDPSLEDRVDFLVRPLVSSEQDSSQRRRELQVDLAQLILEKFVSLAETWSPGVEFIRLVVKPWCTGRGTLPMERRNVTLSVEVVKSRVQAGETTTAWIVDGELVNLIDLLSGRALRAWESSLGKKCEEAEMLMIDLGLAPEQQQGNFIDLPVVPHPESHETGHEGIKRHMDDGFAMIITKIDELKISIEAVRKDLNKILSRQNKVLKTLQALERFTRDEVRNSVPRFMYLTKASDPSGIWMTLKDMVVERATLHFLCEAHYNDHSLHEVSNQEGVEIRNLKALARKIAPWLIWSAKVAFVVGKVASQALLPGLGQLIQTFPLSSSEGTNIGTSVAYWLSAALLAGAEVNPFKDATHMPSIQDSRSTPVRPIEVNDGLKKVLTEMIGDLEPMEFQTKFNLKRAVVNDSGYVVWICNDCFIKYQNDGAVEQL